MSHSDKLNKQFELRTEPAPLTVWGREMIDENSFDQINNAAKLPVTVRVALMPDAHVGYGLPIGGIAALEGAIAPYMVGVDIGCRMHATIFGRSPEHLNKTPEQYKEWLTTLTWFGRTAPKPEERLDHPILDDERWNLLPAEFADLHALAVRQLGTSGGGNHFVEWTNLRVEEDNPFDIKAGEYIALVSHSGSRAVGYKIANHYCQIAEQQCPFLPDDLRKLAWLNHADGLGQEYEMAMNLAGDFARANHDIIHERITSASGMDVLGTIQNHHNFAWRVDGEGAYDKPTFIHRKGATPAAQGVNGIIPGSMATPGFFVEGQCDTDENILSHPSLNSASHGSGRKLGRDQAQQQLNSRDVRQFLQEKGVTLIGGGLDEAPDAYKNSRDVLAAQSDLVRIWAEFNPVIVRMAGDGRRSLGESGSIRDKSNSPRRGKKKNRDGS